MFRYPKKPSASQLHPENPFSDAETQINNKKTAAKIDNVFNIWFVKPILQFT
ncbi:hypothetical protein Hanom_Chr13g01234471 [Helianthus anomalus]